MKRLDANELLFFMAYTLFAGVNILYSSFYQGMISSTMHTVFEGSALLLLVYKEFLNRDYSQLDLKGAVPLIILTAIMFMNTGGLDEFGMVITFVFIFSARNVSIDKILHYSIWLTLGLVIFVNISAELNIITNYYTVTPRLRYYMGFRYSLFGPGYILNCALMETILSEKKVHWFNWAVILGYAFLTYELTDSRMPFLLTILLFAAMILYKVFPAVFTNKIISSIMVWSFVLFGLAAVLTAVFYDEHITWMALLDSDKYLAGRLSNAHVSIQKYGISLLGQKITWGGHGLSANGIETKGADYNYVDCLYVKLLQRCGILFYIITAGLTTKAMRYAVKKNDWTLVIAGAVLAVRCMIDDLSLFSYYNIFWYVIPYLLREQCSNGYLK